MQLRYLIPWFLSIARPYIWCVQGTDVPRLLMLKEKDCKTSVPLREPAIVSNESREDLDSSSSARGDNKCLTSIASHYLSMFSNGKSAHCYLHWILPLFPPLCRVLYIEHDRFQLSLLQAGWANVEGQWNVRSDYGYQG